MSNIIELKKGLDIPISGNAAQKTKKVIIPDVVAVTLYLLCVVCGI